MTSIGKFYCNRVFKTASRKQNEFLFCRVQEFQTEGKKKSESIRLLHKNVLTSLNGRDNPNFLFRWLAFGWTMADFPIGTFFPAS